MKLVTFTADGRTRLGAWRDGRCYDLNAAAALAGRPTIAPDLRGFLALGEEGLDGAQAVLDAVAAEGDVALAGIVFERGQVTLEPPVTDPSKIIAIGLNYRDHCLECNLPVPDVMTVFGKFPSALTGDRQPIVLPPREVTEQVDFEAELAVVIGRQGVDIPESRAYDYIAGYLCLNDVSARDVQFGDGGKQWLHGKSFDTFAPTGPWLVTRDEVPDPHTLDITCEVNGQRYQASNTRHLIFSVPYLVSELSKSITLFPGDIISTGTPGGVGVFRDPPVFLAPGDEVVVTVAGVGRLTNPVVSGPPTRPA